MKNVAKNWTGYFLAGMLVLALWAGSSPVRASSVAVASNNSYVAAATDVLSSRLTVGSELASLDVTVGLVTTASVVNVTLVDVATGLVTRTFGLNGGSALTAGVLYSFSLDVSPSFTYNFQVATATTPVLAVREVRNDRR